MNLSGPLAGTIMMVGTLVQQYWPVCAGRAAVGMLISKRRVAVRRRHGASTTAVRSSVGSRPSRCWWDWPGWRSAVITGIRQRMARHAGRRLGKRNEPGSMPTMGWSSGV